MPLRALPVFIAIVAAGLLATAGQASASQTARVTWSEETPTARTSETINEVHWLDCNFSDDYFKAQRSFGRTACLDGSGTMDPEWDRVWEVTSGTRSGSFLYTDSTGCHVVYFGPRESFKCPVRRDLERHPRIVGFDDVVPTGSRTACKCGQPSVSEAMRVRSAAESRRRTLPDEGSYTCHAPSWTPATRTQCLGIHEPTMSGTGRPAATAAVTASSTDVGARPNVQRIRYRPAAGAWRRSQEHIANGVVPRNRGQKVFACRCARRCAVPARARDG